MTGEASVDAEPMLLSVGATDGFFLRQRKDEERDDEKEPRFSFFPSPSMFSTHSGWCLRAAGSGCGGWRGEGGERRCRDGRLLGLRRLIHGPSDFTQSLRVCLLSIRH